jgi:hypothetical protein
MLGLFTSISLVNGPLAAAPSVSFFSDAGAEAEADADADEAAAFALAACGKGERSCVFVWWPRKRTASFAEPKSLPNEENRSPAGF